jgi:hypothetical protein
MRVSDGTRAAHFDRWGLEGETIELAALRGTIAGRTRYLALARLDFVARYLGAEDGDDPGRPPLDGRHVRRLATQLLSDGMVGAIAVAFSPPGLFIPAGGDEDQSIGVLRLARATDLRISDGRHRQAAIRRALADDPRLAEETIGLELFAHDGPPRRRRRPSTAVEDHTVDAARLMALTMALDGRTRDQVDGYLSDHFDLHPGDALLDEVFTTDPDDRK